MFFSQFWDVDYENVTYTGQFWGKRAILSKVALRSLLKKFVPGG